MPNPKTPTSDQTWFTQRSRRSQGWYYQAVHGRGKTKRIVTLGYLSDEAAESALTTLRALGDHLLACRVPTGLCEPDIEIGPEGMFGLAEPVSTVLVSHRRGIGTPILSNDQIRRIALDRDSAILDEVVADLQRARVEQAIERGDYGSLTLREFHDQLWWPTRSREAAPKTVSREAQVWPVILEVLGHVQIRRLDALRWQAFLGSRTTWSGRSKAICQNAYRMCLKFAVDLGAIEQVHRFRKIAGSTTTTRAKTDALTPDEVVRLLDATTHPVHRALFGVLFGQGPRPGEALALRWEHVDWEGRTILIPGTKTTGSRARVPMTGLTLRELGVWWETQGRPSEGPIFMWRGTPMREFKYALTGAAKRAGLLAEGRKITPYVGRVTFATTAVVAGVSEGAVRAMMRHSHRSTILERVYVRLRTGQVAEAMEAFPTFE